MCCVVLSCAVLRCVELYCVALQFPITALREIKILQQLKHDNVVKLNEICRTKREYRRQYYRCYRLVKVDFPKQLYISNYHTFP